MFTASCSFAFLKHKMPVQPLSPVFQEKTLQKTSIPKVVRALLNTLATPHGLLCFKLVYVLYVSLTRQDIWKEPSVTDLCFHLIAPCVLPSLAKAVASPQSRSSTSLHMVSLYPAPVGRHPGSKPFLAKTLLGPRFGKAKGNILWGSWVPLKF